MGSFDQNGSSDPSWDEHIGKSGYNRVDAVTNGQLIQILDGNSDPIPYQWVLRPQSGPYAPGSPFKHVEFLYLHFDKTTMQTSVNAGDEIGQMVNWEVELAENPNAITNSTHLHFRVRAPDLSNPQDPKLAITFKSGVLTTEDQIENRRFYT